LEGVDGKSEAFAGSTDFMAVWLRPWSQQSAAARAWMAYWPPPPPAAEQLLWLSPLFEFMGPDMKYKCPAAMMGLSLRRLL